VKAGPPEIKIISVRNQQVVLDADLASVYGVTTKRLNEQFRRNRERFPADFAFRLTKDEADLLSPATPPRRQIGFSASS
jgi:hypothetical protein